METKTLEIGARVEPNLVEALDIKAREQRRTRADIIRMACEAYVLPPEPVVLFDADDYVEEAEDHLAERLDDEGLELRPGVTQDDVITAMTETVVDALEESWRDYDNYFVDDRFERWSNLDSGEVVREALSGFDMNTVAWDPSFGTLEAWDAQLAEQRRLAEERRQRERAERDRRDAALKTLRDVLPEKFLAAMQPGTEYRYYSPEFRDIIERECENLGFTEGLAHASFGNQILDELVWKGLVAKSDDGPRKLTKVVE
jgi:hypothetical protein